jgi:hypothetical protein
VDSVVNAFVVSGLVKRRAQLAGDIQKAHEDFCTSALATRRAPR